MICGALQTLNEDAFEDVAVSERPSPTGELSIQQYSLAPISEELGSPTHSRNVEDFFNNTANYVMQNTNADDMASNSTVIVMPNFPSTSVDDTRL